MEKKVVIMEVTEEEAELLAAVRNYNKSFPTALSLKRHSKI